MSVQLLFYTNAIAVNSKQHGALSVKAGESYSFARNVNSVPLTTVEFPAALREYVVVFAGEEDGVIPVAILGTSADRNLFVDQTGHWHGDYVPAFVRRYPFVFSGSDDGKKLTLCIDESFEGCNREGRGERLFDVDGNRTQYLQTVLDFMQRYQAEFQRTQTFCTRLKELDLLKPMQASFTLPNGERRHLGGFMVVDRDKLKALDDAELARMARGDELELIYLHLQSMNNFGGLLKRAGAKPAATEQRPGDEADAVEGDGGLMH